MDNDTIINLFCTILSLKTLEINKGNEYEKAQIKLKYIRNIHVTEYINIFKLVRNPTLFEFVFYFKNI